MHNKDILIECRGQAFTNMNFEIHDSSQIEFSKCKGKTRTKRFEDGE